MGFRPQFDFPLVIKMNRKHSLGRTGSFIFVMVIVTETNSRSAHVIEVCVGVHVHI